jgi:hypothetical protein
MRDVLNCPQDPWLIRRWLREASIPHPQIDAFALARVFLGMKGESNEAARIGAPVSVDLSSKIGLNDAVDEGGVEHGESGMIGGAAFTPVVNDGCGPNP